MLHQDRQQHHWNQRLSGMTWSNLMTRSTIYDAHAMRRFRTKQLRDDPRPAIIRVLSGLPGFRMIILPYQAPMAQLSSSNPSIALQSQQQSSLDECNVDKNFIDPTVFTRSFREGDLSYISEENTNKNLDPSILALVVFSASAAVFRMFSKRIVSENESAFTTLRSTSKFTGPYPRSGAANFLSLGATHSAAFAAYTPNANHNLHKSMFLFHRSSAPLARGIVIVSLLTYVGYRSAVNEKL